MVLPLTPGTGPAPRAPGVVNQGLAQGIYLAQLSAVKGDCKCNTCKILRRASDTMIAQFVGRTPAPAVAPGEDIGATELDAAVNEFTGGDT